MNRIQEKVDGWQPALDWAREHGANIRKGKISKYLARVRIDDAGLRGEWNKLFPDYAFSEHDVDVARDILDNRRDYYDNLKKHSKKR